MYDYKCIVQLNCNSYLLVVVVVVVVAVAVE
jgi:hypothetical protein